MQVACTVAFKVILWLFAWWALAQVVLRCWCAPYWLALSLALNVRIAPPLGQVPPLQDAIIAFVGTHSWLLCAISVWLALAGRSHIWFGIDVWWAAVAASSGMATALHVAAFLRFRRQVAFLQGLRRPESVRRPILAWLHPFLYCPGRLKGDVRADIVEPNAGRPSVYVWYAAAGADEARPIVLFVHGGGWNAGKADWVTQNPLLHALAAAGWVVLSPNYRKRVWPQHLDDSEAALRWACSPEFSSTYRADASRGVVLGGCSAGGHIAAALAARILGERPAAWTPAISAMLLFYPALDPGGQFGCTARCPFPCPCFRLRWGQSLLAWFFEHRVLGGQPDLWPSAEVVPRLHEDAALAKAWPPTMISHGERDSIVPIEHSEYFLELLAARRPQEVALRDSKRACDVFLRVPYACHSIELAPNLISEAVLDAAFEFAEQIRADKGGS